MKNMNSALTTSDEVATAKRSAPSSKYEESTSGEYSKTHSSLSYDSIRTTDSGYNSCSCQSISSSSNNSGLNISLNAGGRLDTEDPASLSTVIRTTSRDPSSGDSGLSLDSAGDYNPSTHYNDLNKPTNFVPSTVSSTSDSGLGLDFQDSFSKLSVSEECVDPSWVRSASVVSCGLIPGEVRKPPPSAAPSLFEIENIDPVMRLKIAEEAFMPDKDGDNHLHLAIVHGRWDIIVTLILLAPHPAYLDLQNNLYQTALHLAVLTGQAKVVRRLVLAGASLDARNKIGNTPLHMACQKGDLECARELTRPVSVAEQDFLRRTSPPYYRLPFVNIPQNLETRNYEGQTCLHLAAIGQHTELIRYLKVFGANVNAQEGKGGRSPLYLAIEARNPNLVEFLIKECNANIHATTYAGVTPFQIAYGLDPKIAEQLLTFGAYPNYPNFSDSETDSDASLDESMDVCQELSEYHDLKLNGEPLW